MGGNFKFQAQDSFFRRLGDLKNESHFLKKRHLYMTQIYSFFLSLFSADPEGPGICAMFLTLVSLMLVLVTLPFSLCVTVKVVQEYERAVVFRLGRLRSGGAKGPGLFFVMPCVDSYKKVDLRTVSFDVPPQEVSGNT